MLLSIFIMSLKFLHICIFLNLQHWLHNKENALNLQLNSRLILDYTMQVPTSVSIFANLKFTDPLQIYQAITQLAFKALRALHFQWAQIATWKQTFRTRISRLNSECTIIRNHRHRTQTQRLNITDTFNQTDIYLDGISPGFHLLKMFSLIKPEFEIPVHFIPVNLSQFREEAPSDWPLLKIH